MIKAGVVTDPSYQEACRKIAVHPGWVRSINDGDRHFISFTQLCRLSGIDPHKAICWDEQGMRGPRPKRLSSCLSVGLWCISRFFKTGGKEGR
jgi:hypothetical protein